MSAQVPTIRGLSDASQLALKKMGSKLEAEQNANNINISNNRSRLAVSAEDTQDNQPSEPYAEAAQATSRLDDAQEPDDDPVFDDDSELSQRSYNSACQYEHYSN